ncbi:uncharacterized protein LOC124689402 [Lolium rigidum]|uniref:uncharacterized protein LOC124689402 n=1 Tax=Lolium rigidum TaxID=89674 RepID=UPI001F5DD3F8|nr:uncharacterized protein LOC124689402 [Lolium rigidum]
MASIGSDGATLTDAGSPRSASARRDRDMTSRLQNARSLTIQLLKEITDDFSKERIIGQGAYGKVYVAKLENGTDIAVKMLHNTMPGVDDERFLRETISAETTYRALCSEYMQNGSLEKHLSDECNGLDWDTRYKIIKGTSDGLKYLHKGFEEPIYHLDLKPDNILLDMNMEPKLADFGLSRLFGQTKVTQTPLGTPGYVPWEFIHGKVISCKYDIFSLGVVIIKVHANWRNRIQETCYVSRQLEAYCNQVSICTEIALTCMENDRHKRPSIVDIVQRLNGTEAVINKALSWPATWHSNTKDELVKIGAFTGSEGIRDADTRSDFPVLVQVTAPPWRRMEEMPLPGVDIVVVFDRKSVIYSYRAAIRIVIDNLSSNDRVSFVWAGTHANRLMELTFMTPKRRADALALLEVVVEYVENRTDMAAGLREGAEILRGREEEESKSRVGCIVLLSDMKEVQDPSKEKRTSPAQEISTEFPVHAFGLANGHDPEVMKYIADTTSGTYSFCKESGLRDAMKLFMAGITKVAATSIKITLTAHEGIAISSIESGSYGNNVSLNKLSGEIDIRDIYAGEHKNFIVFLAVTEGKTKLVTIGGRYQCLNVMSKQLPNMDVSVLRPPLGCPPAKLAMHHGVAAELARIRLLKGLTQLVELGRRLMFVQMVHIWDHVRLSKDGHSAPEETLSRLGRYVDQMKSFTHNQNENPKQVPYLMSWLSCHQWQRATTKGQYYDSRAFALAKP